MEGPAEGVRVVVMVTGGAPAVLVAMAIGGVMAERTVMAGGAKTVVTAVTAGSSIHHDRCT